MRLFDSSSGKKKRLVLVGGGHSHVLALRELSKRPEPSLEVMLVSDQRYTAYSGMLSGAVAGIYKNHEILIDLELLVEKVREAGQMSCSLVIGRGEGLDHKKGTLLVAQKASFGNHTELTNIPFDLLSIDTGSVPDLRELPGAQRFAVGVKPISYFLKALESYLHQVREGGESQASIVQIGAGASGCELALALMQRFRGESLNLDLTLVEARDRILKDAPLRLSEKVLSHLKRMGVRVLCNTSVKEVKDRAVVLDTGEILKAGFITVTTRPRPGSWVSGLSLAKSKRGFIEIDSKLQTSVGGIFAAGDVAENPQWPWIPRAGVFAVRQAPVLLYNWRSYAQGLALRSYHPQSAWLSLMIDGQGGAFGYRGNFVLPHSKATFWLKDHIDRSFMKQFQ